MSRSSGIFRVTYNKNGRKMSSIVHARDEESAGRSMNGARVLHVRKMGMEDIFHVGEFADAMTKRVTIESFKDKKRRNDIKEESSKEDL